MMTRPIPDVDYITGLDLGQAQDFTALAVLKRKILPDPANPDQDISDYAVGHLERFPLGTSYTAICSRLEQLFARQPLTDSVLAVDQTGVGRPVIDMLKHSDIQAQIRAVTITCGHKANYEDGVWLVPKKELVSALQVILQSRRIKVPSTLPEAQILVQELMNFQVKITPAANEIFGSWREGVHDDLVLAVAIALWIGERTLPTKTFLPVLLSPGYSRPSYW